VFLVNSPPDYFCCDPIFLLDRTYPEVTSVHLPSSLITGCLEYLGILYQPTCVRSGYRLLYDKLSGFSRHQNSTNHPLAGTLSKYSTFYSATDLPIADIPIYIGFALYL
jgi:hypothetical protein